MDKITALTYKMIEFFGQDHQRIHHFLKVNAFAKLIALDEGLDAHDFFIVDAASLVHDCGIKIALEKYGHQNGSLQEQEGPMAARAMLEELSFKEADIKRICYLVGHHHSYSNIDGLDYQILVEADFLVNFYEDNIKRDAIKKAVEKIFKTKKGIFLAKSLFL